MSASIDVYERFASVVKTFSLDSPKDSADQFAELTSAHDNQSGSLLYCENNTWRLLSVLAKAKGKSSAYQHALLKQWVSQIPKDQDLIDRIQEERDVDAEIMNLFKKNRILTTACDEPLKKKRMLQTADDSDSIYKQRFSKLRSNDLTTIDIRSNGDISKNYMYNGYVQYQRHALENSVENIHPKERSVWRKTIKHELQRANGKYKRAVFATLAGESNDLYDTVCDTWEDVIWAYLNERLENLMDCDHISNNNSIILDDIKRTASSKDEIMDKHDPRILFHHIQSALLSNSVPDMIKKIYQAYHNMEIKDTENSALFFSDNSEDRAQLLRFLSTFILYGQQYLGWKENVYSAALISAYAELNGQPSTLRPAVIASYAAKQSPQYHIQIYSNFLQNFDGDEEESTILVQLGKQFGLDMPDILQYTYTHLFKKALENTSTQISTSKPELQIHGIKTDEDRLFFKAIKWLTYDDSMCEEAIEAANMTIRHFLGVYKVYLAKSVFDLFSDSTIERMMYQSTQKTSAQKVLTEFSLHRNLVDALTEYETWQTLMQEKPKDSGSLDDLMKIYKWNDQVEKKTISLDNEMSGIIEGHWLGEDSNETACISKAALRKIYIPEILIRYHNLLASTSSIIPKNKEKSEKIGLRLTDTETDILKDVTSAKRMTDVVNQLSSTLTEV